MSRLGLARSCYDGFGTRPRVGRPRGSGVEEINSGVSHQTRGSEGEQAPRPVTEDDNGSTRSVTESGVGCWRHGRRVLREGDL